MSSIMRSPSRSPKKTRFRWFRRMWRRLRHRHAKFKDGKYTSGRKDVELWREDHPFTSLDYPDHRWQHITGLGAGDIPDIKEQLPLPSSQHRSSISLKPITITAKSVMYNAHASVTSQVSYSGFEAVDEYSEYDITLSESKGNESSCASHVPNSILTERKNTNNARHKWFRSKRKSPSPHKRSKAKYTKDSFYPKCGDISGVRPPPDRCDDSFAREVMHAHRKDSSVSITRVEDGHLTATNPFTSCPPLPEEPNTNINSPRLPRSPQILNQTDIIEELTSDYRKVVHFDHNDDEHAGYDSDFQNVQNQFRAQDHARKHKRAKKRRRRKRVGKKVIETVMRPRHYAPLKESAEDEEEIAALEAEFERKKEAAGLRYNHVKSKHSFVRQIGEAARASFRQVMSGLSGLNLDTTNRNVPVYNYLAHGPCSQHLDNTYIPSRMLEVKH